jgi:integrase
MKKNRLPKYVRRKTAKGKQYLYFDTGQRSEDGKPILTPLPAVNDPTFSRAVATAQDARDKRGTVPTELTVAGLANLWEKSPSFTALAKATQDSYSLYLGQIRERLGIAVAKELAPADVRFIRDGMADRTGAANQFIRTLGSLYSWGRKRGYVENKPVENVELFDQGEHEPWPQWLIDVALESEDATVRLAVGLLYFTAQRIGDVTQMRWTDVREGVIELRQQKTKAEMAIPVHSTLQAILDETPKSAFTILLQDGAPWKPPLLRRYLQRWATGLGATIVAHGLRKSAVNALLEAGCSVAETAAISGQSLQMVEHYAKKRNRRHLATAAIHRWDGRNKTGNGKQK